MNQTDFMVQLATQAPLLAVIVWHYLSTLRTMHRLEVEVLNIDRCLQLILNSNPTLRFHEPKHYTIPDHPLPHTPST